jgi:hypothetical protein
MYPKTIFKMSYNLPQNHVTKNVNKLSSKCRKKSENHKCLQMYPKTIFKNGPEVSQNHVQNASRCSLNYLQNYIRCSPKTIFKMAPDVSQSHLQNTENSTTSTPKPSSEFLQMYSKTILKMAK